MFWTVRIFPDGPNYRCEGFPERDIWSLHVMDEGSCQIGRVLGTSSPSPSPPPSPGSSGWHSGQETVFGVFKLNVDSYERSQSLDTEVLHRISSRIYPAEWFGLGSHFGTHFYLVSISKNTMFMFWEEVDNPKFWQTNPKCSNGNIYSFHPSKIQILEKSKT